MQVLLSSSKRPLSVDPDTPRLHAEITAEDYAKGHPAGRKAEVRLNLRVQDTFTLDDTDEVIIKPIYYIL